MPETIKLSGSADPAPTPSPAPVTSPNPNTGPTVLNGSVVSEADAIAASSGANISSLVAGSGGSGTPLGSGNSVPVSGLVDAKLAVELMDATIPALMVFLCYKIGMKLKKTDLQLTEREKTTLTPILQKCLEQLMINFSNPWVALSVSLITIYGSKIVEKGLPQVWERKQQKLEDEARKQQQQPAKTVQPVDAGGTTSGVAVASPETTKPTVREYYPSEAEIKAKMDQGKHGKKRAIELLIAINKKKQQQVA